MKTWNNPELYQLGIESTKGATFKSGAHDGIYVNVEYKGDEYPVELHS